MIILDGKETFSKRISLDQYLFALILMIALNWNEHLPPVDEEMNYYSNDSSHD